MEYKDYYDIMGVERGATQDERKRAYRKLARKYHPDFSEHGDAEARLKEVGEAYEALKDPEKRAAYDQFGVNWKAGQDFRFPPGWDEGYSVNDDIRCYCVNRRNTSTDYVKAFSVMSEFEVKALAYCLMKPPFIEEKQR